VRTSFLIGAASATIQSLSADSLQSNKASCLNKRAKVKLRHEQPVAQRCAQRRTAMPCRQANDAEIVLFAALNGIDSAF
jgi:hypothetical protein